MKLLGVRSSVYWLVLALLVTLAMPSCGYGSGRSYSSITGYMAGQWDFTVTNAKGHVPFVIEAFLNQDHHGNISSAGSVTPNGPAGSVSAVFIWGPSLAGANAISVDYPGFTCNGSDNGDRSLAGTLDSSNHVTLTLQVGGTAVFTITGTLNTYGATPAFTGTFSTSGACGGASGTVTGQFPVIIPSGPYAGTSAADSTENITLSLTNMNGSLSGSGSDSKLGNLTLTGNEVGNAFSGTLTYASSPANSGPVFGYYDPKLGTAGSILLVSFAGVNVNTCPNGEPSFQFTCEIATLALP